jgi:transmembrane sensor
MNTDNKFNQIDEMILAFLRGKITAEELAYLKNWIALENANKDHFRKMYMLWKAYSITDQEDEKINKAFQKVYLKTLELDDDDSHPFKEWKGYFSISMLKWVAVVLLSICTGAVLSYLFQKDHLNKIDSITQNEINVPLGSKSRIVLPDHSVVWLNAGSKLTYSMIYGKKIREVNLEGEGYFKVAKMPDKPFIVHTLKANIKALGTEFNVKAYSDENTIETILVKGSVIVDKIAASGNISDNHPKKSIVLTPGQKVLIYKNDIVSGTNELVTSKPTKVKGTNHPRTPMVASNDMNLLVSNTEVETSWKNPSWVIQGENIKELFIELGRRFNVSILLQDKELEKYKFSGIIQSETLEQVFDLMSLTIPMSYSINKGKVDITLNTNLDSRYKRAYKN